MEIQERATQDCMAKDPNGVINLDRRGPIGPSQTRSDTTTKKETDVLNRKLMGMNPSETKSGKLAEKPNERKYQIEGRRPY